VVEKVVPDPDRDGLVDVILKPAAHLDRLDEVLVITSTQPRFSPQEQQDINASETMKGSESSAVNDQMKASAIMAEKLPGLIDPNLPSDQQPLHDNSNPNPAGRPPQPLHPDEFSPSDATPIPAGTGPGDGSDAPKPKAKIPATQPAAKPTPLTPQRDQ
jgi:rod shape-determining protein MreC